MVMKKTIYLSGIIIVCYFSFLACRKVNETKETSRLTVDFKKAMADVGRLHNVGLAKGIKDHPEWANYLKRAPNIYPITGVIAINSVGGRKTNNYEATFEGLLEITREYFRQFTIDSLPQYNISLSVIDTMTTFPNEFWLDPDSATVSRIESAVGMNLSYEFKSSMQLVFDAFHNAQDYAEFSNTLNSILANGETNIGSDLEFYSLAMGISIAKQSYAYWINPVNIQEWEYFLDSHSTNSVQVNSLKVKVNRLNTDVEKMAIADAAGAFRGGVLGGTLGSIGGPAGTAAGVVGGALYTGVEASFFAGAYRLAKRIFGW